MSGYVGRLAPSPTGALHLGNARTFMIAWLRARSQGGKVIFRMEDLDHPKDKPGAAAQAIEDLKWLGFDWDGEYVQSERKDIYREALEALGDLVYPCVCSRKDVESAQSAPHAGEQLYYPGTCRGRFKSWAEAKDFLAGPRVPRDSRDPSCSRTPCWRFAVAPGSRVVFDDAFAGRYEQDVSRTLGDFPLARDEFGAGYTLACAVDDLLMGITEVVRGDDLLAATPAQILLARALSIAVDCRHTATSPSSSDATASVSPSATVTRASRVTARRGERRRSSLAFSRCPAAGRRRASASPSPILCRVLIWALSPIRHL